MKKSSILFFLMLLTATSISAKEAPIIGKWLLTVAEVEGQPQEVYSEVVFKEDGYAEMDGRVFGTWTFDKKLKSLTIESEMIKEFAGTRVVSKPSKNKMILSGEGLKLYFLKLDQAKINAENGTSGLVGLWQYSVDGELTYLKISAPDQLTYFAKSAYSTSSGAGTWIYNKEESSIIILSSNRQLSGKHTLSNLSSNSFELQKGDQEIAISKAGLEDKKLEKLTFTEDEIYTSLESNTENLTLEGIGFLWEDGEAKYNYLKKITRLNYAKSEYISELGASIATPISTPVTFNEDYYQIEMDPIFGLLSANEMDAQNLFYPLEVEYVYRVIGEEEVAVAAGTFKCKIVEAIGGYGDTKAKLYLVEDQPGIYAKIIIETKDNDKVDYSSFELTSIEGEN